MNDRVPATTGFDFNKPTIVALLYAASVLIGFTSLIGLIMAYVWKGEPGGAWEESHFRYHIRSFWIGLVFGVLAIIPTILTLTVAGWILYPALAVWFLVRSIKAMLTAQRQEAIANPGTWLV